MRNRLALALLASAFGLAAPSSAQPVQLRLAVVEDGTVIELHGDIGFGIADSFELLLARYPAVTTVRLDSVGGNLFEATSIAASIAARGFVTHIRGTCASACGVIFAAGRERWIDKGSRLGFHAWSWRITGADDPDEARGQQTAIFAAAGFDPRLIDHAVTVPPNDMWYPTLDELVAARAVTRVLPAVAPAPVAADSVGEGPAIGGDPARDIPVVGAPARDVPFGGFR